MELHEAALALMKVAFGDSAELQKREEALTLEESLFEDTKFLG